MRIHQPERERERERERGEREGGGGGGGKDEGERRTKRECCNGAPMIGYNRRLNGYGSCDMMIDYEIYNRLSQKMLTAIKMSVLIRICIQ